MGRCKTFDVSADGYGRGEGFAAVVLRRSSQRADSSASHSMAIIRGSAVNQGGRSSGLTAPNGPAQTALISAALASGALQPANIAVLSVHGTGTALGDPIELGAVSEAVPAAAAARPLSLVSNKACYGHTEGTAGLTGLLLAASTLRHAALAPIMHLREVNPHVAATLNSRAGKAKDAGMLLPREAAPVPLHTRAAVQLAGSSSFGMSGVNAHMLVAIDADLQITQVSGWCGR